MCEGDAMKKAHSIGLVAVLSVLLSALAACNIPPAVTADADKAASGVSGGISEPTTAERRQGFFFLPPLVPEPQYGGVFDPSLHPTVRIEALGSGGPPLV